MQNALNKKNYALQPLVTPTFKEFVVRNLNMASGSYNEAICVIQERLEKDIQKIKLIDSDFFEYKILNEFDESFLNKNWMKLIEVFKNYTKSKLHLPDWLKANCLQNYSETVELIKRKIVYQFVNLLKDARNWERHFKSDIIFNRAFTKEGLYDLSYIEIYVKSFFNCDHTINNFCIHTKPNTTSIAYSTIFEVYPQEKVSPTEKEKLLKEIQKRIGVQKKIKEQTSINQNEIIGLIEFYQRIEDQLKQIVILKFVLLNEKSALEAFKSICKYFLRSPKIFNYTLKQLLDLVDQEHEQGLVFDIDKKDEALFYLFIDTIMKHCIVQIDTTKVIESRFTIGGKKITYTSNKKSRALKKLLRSLTEDSSTEKLKSQLINHKYLCDYIVELKKPSIEPSNITL